MSTIVEIQTINITVVLYITRYTYLPTIVNENTELNRFDVVIRTWLTRERDKYTASYHKTIKSAIICLGLT